MSKKTPQKNKKGWNPCGEGQSSMDPECLSKTSLSAWFWLSLAVFLEVFLI